MCLGISLRTSSQSKILAQNDQTFHCHFVTLVEVEVEVEQWNYGKVEVESPSRTEEITDLALRLN